MSGAPSTAINTINTRIAEMKNNYMVVSSASYQGTTYTNRLFYADFTGDPVPSNGGHSGGVLYQLQTKRLANGTVDGVSHDWKYILKYFYDNCTLGDYTLSTMSFKTQNSHTFNPSYNCSSTKHWRVCTACDCTKSGSYISHSFITSYGQTYCNVCGYIYGNPLE